MDVLIKGVCRSTLELELSDEAAAAAVMRADAAATVCCLSRASLEKLKGC